MAGLDPVFGRRLGLFSSGSVLVLSAGSEHLLRRSLEHGVERLRRGKVLLELALAGWNSVVLHRIASGAECLEAASIDAQAGLVRLGVDHETLDGSGVKAGLGSEELVPVSQRNRLTTNHHRLFEVVQGRRCVVHADGMAGVVYVFRGDDKVRGDPGERVLVRIGIEARGISVEERQKVSLGRYACHDRPPSAR